MIGWHDLVLLVAGIVGFEILVRSDLGGVARRIGRVGFDARAAMTSAEIDDDEKERRVRAMAGTTLADTGRLALRLALVAAACTAVVWLGSLVVGVPVETVVARAASWQGLLGLTLAIVAWAALRRRLGGGDAPRTG